jgi:beta-galactosidase
MRIKKSFRLALVLLCIGGGVFPFCALARAQAQNADSKVLIDASQAAAPPQPLSFAISGKSPDGHVLGANSRYLTLDGKPWFPVMGEFHYSRYPAEYWEEEILKMKAGGIEIVSTYIFWIHQEEIEGQFDWSGQRDLRRFVQLCAKHGMYVWIRIGPWDHGEVRNGGLPDWLLDHYPIRQNDPQYLRYVQRFDEQIAAQVKGQFWQDGGPIIGVQIENEYKERGPGKGAEHMLTLLDLAHRAGLNAPFYTATAWDDATVPTSAYLPVFNGYAEQFWNRKIDELPPSPNYFFTAIRCEEIVGEDLRSTRPDIDARYAAFPYLTAEMGGGMELSYHRRPLMSAEDTAAMAVVKLGSGVTLYGYYMFHGGTNPDGKKTTLQESQLTGYPNDLPVKSYDFQAPLGEFGQMKESFRELKSFHLFLRDFGSSLAPMASYLPEKTPRSKSDTSTPRVAARIEKDRGFLFINNYQRSHPLPERRDLQVGLKLATGIVQVPKEPINIPSGAYMIWPVNLDVGGAVLQYATAQLLCKLDDPGTYVFFAWPGVPARFVFASAGKESIEAPHAAVKREHGLVYVDGIAPGQEPAIRIRSQAGQVTQIIVLSREDARNIWKADVGGRSRLLFTSANVYYDQNRIHLRSSDPARIAFGTYPKLDRIPDGFVSAGDNGIFTLYSTHLQATTITAQVEKLRDADPQPPVAMGKEVAEAPAETAFAGAAQWRIRIPAVESSAVKDLRLQITYEGDIARLYEGGKLFTDDFFNGAPWVIGIRPIPLQGTDPELQLGILPLRKDAPIYLPAGIRPNFPPSGEVARLKSVEVVPEYEAVADLSLAAGPAKKDAHRR